MPTSFLDLVHAFKWLSSCRLWRVKTDWLMTTNFLTKTTSAAPFPVAFCCKLAWLELGLFTWSYQEISVVLLNNGQKIPRILIKWLPSMQEDAKPHIEIFTSQSRFYWINLTSTTMACTMGNQRQNQMPSFISYSHISRHQIKITSILEYDPVIEKKTRWSSFDRIYSFLHTIHNIGGWVRPW